MSQTEIKHYDDQIGKHRAFILRALLTVAIAGFIFTVTGYLVVFLTRLLIKPSRAWIIPGPRESFFIGIGVWWCFIAPIMFDSYLKEQQDNYQENPDQFMHPRDTYDYQIRYNKMTFFKPPIAGCVFEANWINGHTWEYCDKPIVEGPPIYVIGPVDGKNCIFYLSTSPNTPKMGPVTIKVRNTDTMKINDFVVNDFGGIGSQMVEMKRVLNYNKYNNDASKGETLTKDYDTTYPVRGYYGGTYGSHIDLMIISVLIALNSIYWFFYAHNKAIKFQDEDI